MSNEADLEHIPTRPVIPTEEDLPLERPPLKPGNCPWEQGIHARNKTTGEVVHVRCVEYMTRQFRAVGMPRTHWYNTDDFVPIVEPSAADVAREAATKELAELRGSMSPEQLAIVDVLADDADPIRALAKIKALRQIGSLQVADASVVEGPDGDGPYRTNARRRVPKVPTNTPPEGGD